MLDLKLNSTDDLKKEGKSFYWASFFLPYSSKINAGTLYSICRYFDNIADKDTIDKSLFFQESINEIKYNKDNIVNIFLKKNNINIFIFIDLIHGFIIDQNHVFIKTKSELIKYSYHVAGTVGLMMSNLIGVKNKKALPCAVDLGIAMQLTNIARDIHEDAKMKRIYIPIDWIPNLNLSVLSGKIEINAEQEKQFVNAVNRLIDLSECFYNNGFSGLKYIPLRSRIAIFVAANIYRGIGIKIKKDVKKYFRKRAYLNLFEKTLITFHSLIKFFLIRFINYKYLKVRESMPNENL